MYICLFRKLFLTYCSSFRRKVTNKKPRPGVTSAALQEAHEIFGNVDDLLKRRKQGLTEMSGFDDPPEKRKKLRNIGGFDPTILSEKYMTEKDDIIHNIDFPERLQVSFISMYRKDECPSLFKDPEQLEADGLQNSYEKKPALMWHKLFGRSALTLQSGASF
ncbi:hypothetical protein AgCh_017493 [Apium graveolens]